MPLKNRRTYHKETKDRKYLHPPITDITWAILKEMYREKLEAKNKKKTKKLF